MPTRTSAFPGKRARPLGGATGVDDCAAQDSHSPRRATRRIIWLERRAVVEQAEKGAGFDSDFGFRLSDFPYVYCFGGAFVSASPGLGIVLDPLLDFCEPCFDPIQAPSTPSDRTAA